MAAGRDRIAGRRYAYSAGADMTPFRLQRHFGYEESRQHGHDDAHCSGHRLAAGVALLQQLVTSLSGYTILPASIASHVLIIGSAYMTSVNSLDFDKQIYTLSHSLRRARAFSL